MTTSRSPSLSRSPATEPRPTVGSLRADPALDVVSVNVPSRLFRYSSWRCAYFVVSRYLEWRREVRSVWASHHKVRHRVWQRHGNLGGSMRGNIVVDMGGIVT